MLIVGKIALRPHSWNPNSVRLYCISLSAHKHLPYTMHETSMEEIVIPGHLMLQKNFYGTNSPSICVWCYDDVSNCGTCLIICIKV